MAGRAVVTGSLSSLLAVGLLFLLTGCTQPGPRALLQGEKKIQEGHYAEAVELLQKATELLPKTAQAWNHLGLAYQGNGQPEEALKAYRVALSLNHKLAAARYNLGCLYLEQNNLSGAADELTSYTMLQPMRAEGWLKLGSAHLRAHRLEFAERCFKGALELRPNDLEALNGLGMAQFQRRRWAEANNYFNAALAQNPNYAPALLNGAVLQQQGLNNRAAALQKYRRYLALQPRPAGADAVEVLAQQIDLELNPVIAAAPVPTPRTNPVVPQLVPKTNPVPSLARHHTNPPPTPLLASTSRPVAVQPVTPARTSSTVVGPVAAPVPTPALPSTPPPVPPPSPVVTKPVTEAPRLPVRPVAVEPPAIEITRVAEDLVVKPPQDLSSPSAAGVQRPPSVVATNASPSAASGTAITITNAPRRSLLAKLNPFSARSKSETEGAKVAGPRSGTAVTADPAEAVSARTVSSADIPRYSYLAPAKPTAGNHTEAEQFFGRGLKAQQANRRSQAIKEYQLAVKTDPAYFDAYYNLGLAALDASEVKLSLWACEIALALKPESADARYNLALALKAGGYFLDAADQLENLLQQDNNHVRSHLSLANLCARQLGQATLAREHYQKVLELDPRHPESSRIRDWIASNP